MNLAGLEPASLAAQHFKCCVYANSTTGPENYFHDRRGTRTLTPNGTCV